VRFVLHRKKSLLGVFNQAEDFIAALKQEFSRFSDLHSSWETIKQGRAGIAFQTRMVAESAGSATPSLWAAWVILDSSQTAMNAASRERSKL
jgi:hypothetical protein